MKEKGVFFIMLKKHAQSTHQQTIFRWFSKIFITVSLIFCFALIPLFAQSKNIFSDLQTEKRNQMLNSGASRISSTVTGMLNTSKALRDDSRFNHLRYLDTNFDDITITTQHQLQSELDNLTQPFDFVSHTALQLNEEVIITDSTIFFKNQLGYYPNFFQVDDLSFDEWTNLLSATGTGFTPVCHIKTYSSEYDALVFVTPWTNSTYLYTCINVSTIKQLIIEEANLKDCYFSVTSTDDTVLYSDIPNDVAKYQTFSEVCSAGRIKISVHIPDSVFFQNMKPFYLFFSIYVLACIMLLLSANIFGAKQATKPILNIIDVLEQSRNGKPANNQSGFEFITNSIIEYQTTVSTQQKILQTRFFEKAINGQLVRKDEIHDFHLHFPNFPEKYYMLLIRLWTYSTGAMATPYQEPLFLLQTFLDDELSYTYLQQLNDTELLLVLSKEDYENAYETLNFLIKNINQEEQTYHAWCITSSMYNNVEDLSTAYQQLRTVDGTSFSDFQDRVCAVTDYLEESKIPVTMIDLMTLYTAITSGNQELAMNRLSAYSTELSMQENSSYTKPVFEIIRSMLSYIKVDHLQLLNEQHIPTYHSGQSLYEQLADTVKTFCSMISEHNNLDKDTFTQELFSYIDAHYTDCDICLTSLKTHFKCSESTIRKVFKRVTDVPIARYIEQKRMLLANDLLAQNEKSVTEIALECGYSLPHSFYKAYKRVYGHAPTLPNNARGEVNEQDI